MSGNGRVMWLWWWLGVLMAGCGQAAFPVPSPQPLPLLSLPIFTAAPTPTPRLLATPMPSIFPDPRFTPIAFATRPGPDYVSLLSTPPTCYETPVGSLWCLGLVHNQLTTALQRVIVRVYLVDISGSALLLADTPIARSVLLPGESSPYGVLFDATPDKMAGPVAVIMTASTAQGRWPRLEVHDIKAAPQESGFRISGLVVQGADMPDTAAGQITLIITLFDDQNRVTGFRQWRVFGQAASTRKLPVSFAIDTVPQGPGTIRAEVSAERELS